MTERLYYRDPSLLTFEGRIVETGQLEGRWYSVLDRSAFYPNSGGQLHDTGTLNGVAIGEVVERDDEVLHLSERPVGEVGQSVRGEVDAERRRKFRQQHTAQHILSQACITLFGVETVSVHLGEEYGAVELGVGQTEPGQIEQAEALANEIVQRNIPVEIIFAKGEEIAKLPLRKMPEREGELRVIRIGDFDCSACGGTHVNGTAEVGVIKVTGTEKLRGRVLVKFLAGVQAFRDYQVRFAVTDQLSKAFTCAVVDLPGNIEKLSLENKNQRKDITALQKEVIPLRARGLAASVEVVDDLRIVKRAASGMDAGLAGQLASAAADEAQAVVLLVAEGRLIVAVPSSGPYHAGELAKKLASQTGLRGGGSNRVAQLGGADASMLDSYRDALVSILHA